MLSYFNISPHAPSFILTALRPWWGQVHFWAQCKQTSLWGFDDRPSSDYFYHPGVPVASYLWLWARWKHVHFLPRCQGQELCRRVLQHSHTRSNQVFSLRCSILLSCCFSSSCMAPFFLSCTSLLDSSSLGLELVNNIPYVKNILTEWQFAWKRSKQRLVRMGVVWEWGIIWLPSSLCYILSKICFSGGESHKVAWYAHFQSFESYPWTWFSSYVGLCYSSRGCDGEMWTVRKGRPGLMTPCGLVQSFQYPSHKPWFIWTEQLHRPTNLIHWPSYNPRGKRGPEKNGVFRLIVLSTNARFTSTVLKCVCEKEYKMKTLCLQNLPF